MSEGTREKDAGVLALEGREHRTGIGEVAAHLAHAHRLERGRMAALEAG